LRAGLTVSGALPAAFGTAPSKPHGYCGISSEWASTATFTLRLVLRVLISLSRSSAPRLASGAKSVRRRRMPSIEGSS
jgi:hypothetical protein